MLNDWERNEYYRRALQQVIPNCGKECSVLDVGAGSGLLSMMAAHAGAADVLAIEANPDLAALAERTVAANKAKNFPGANVTIVADLSSKVHLEQMPHGRQADVLVTETFGTMLLGEGAINFVPDARDRLLKKGGVVIPAGGCQYATLVEVPELDAMTSPRDWEGLDLSRLGSLQDTVYWKATYGANRLALKPLSERICVLEIDWYTHTRENIPTNSTFRLTTTNPGTVHAVLFDWDVWSTHEGPGRQDLLTTVPGSRRFAGDVAWGWLLQVQELVGADWKHGTGVREEIKVQEGDKLDLGVEFIAGGISMHARVRHSPQGEHSDAPPAKLPDSLLGAPKRMRSVARGDLVEASEYYLPIAGDTERHDFYGRAVDLAIAQVQALGVAKPTLLDVSGGAGVPALHAAKQHGLQAMTLTQRKEYANVLRKVAEQNGLGDLHESYHADPREFIDALLPGGDKVDIVVLDPPGTPMYGTNPFALLPTIRKKLMKAGGIVVPARVCLEVGIMESDELAQMFSVPNGHYEEIDVHIWNNETRHQKILERYVPYTKWFGHHSTMAQKWLSKPKCVFEVDMNEYGRGSEQPEDVSTHSLPVVADGNAHALVARWAIFGSPDNSKLRLGAESEYLGRTLTWAHYSQAVALPDTGSSVLEPVPMKAGEDWGMQLTIRQGSGKITGGAGPEFTLRLIQDGALPGRGEL